MAPIRLGPPPLGDRGDPGLFGPRSMVWRVARERALLAGGPAALLMQIAHPLVAAGVDDHSDFRRDPFARLLATLEPTLAVAFGDRSQALAAAATVARAHRRIRGRLGSDAGPYTAGTPYRAGDQDLALWVHATLWWTSATTYRLLVGPLSPSERERHYEEGKAFAEVFGLERDALPPRYEDFGSYMEGVLSGGSLFVDGTARRLAREILHPQVPAGLRPVAGLIRALTTGVLPAHLRAAYGLEWGPPARAAFRMSVTSVRAAIRLLPPTVRYWPHYRAAVARMRE